MEAFLLRVVLEPLDERFAVQNHARVGTYPDLQNPELAEQVG